ncbi:MAG: Ribulose-phosphate 3-epimerase, partial [uncultured Acidimicrobiales bacterium]
AGHARLNMDAVRRRHPPRPQPAGLRLREPLGGHTRPRGQRDRAPPRRRDGRRLRAQLHLRHRHRPGPEEADRPAARAAPHDRRARAPPRDVRQGRGRRHHHPLRGVAPPPPQPHPDTRARLPGRRRHQPEHPRLVPRRHDGVDRPGPGHDHQPRLRRPEADPQHVAQGRAGPKLDRAAGPSHRGRGGRRRRRQQRQILRRRRRQRAGGRLGRLQPPRRPGGRWAGGPRFSGSRGGQPV